MRTGTVSYKLEDLRKGVIIPIGIVGENDFTRVIFDAEEVFKKHPEAQVTMKVQPPKGGIYPATVTRDGNAVIWQVKAADVAHRGSGELQLTFTADTMVEKSYIAKTDIKRSLVGNGPAPDPVQDWVDEAQEALEDIESAEVHQPIIGLDGYWYTWDQGTGEYEKTNTKAQGQGADVIDDTAGEGDTDKTWSADKLDTEITDVKNAIQGKYTMPSGGIPASDLADGVIPVVDSALSYSSENAVQNKVVKGALDGKAPVIINTATGNHAVFNDGGGMPIKSLLIKFTPKQTGSGDPSPSNIRPIVPWNGLTVYHSGADTSEYTETDISFPSPVYGGTLDVVSGVLTVGWVMASFKRTVFGAVQEGALDYRQYTDSTLPVAKTDGSSWYNARREQKSNICVTANPYSETSFGNLIGVVFSFDAFQKKPTFRISDALYQSLTDTDDIEFVYELATPQEIQLTPAQITALVGNNTIWSDADGQLIVEYPADTETFIANQHRNFIAPELSSMIADIALVKNDFRIVGNNLYKITSAIASGGTLTPNTNCVKTTLAEVIKPLLT